MKLLLASNNAKKRAELQRILALPGLEVLTPADAGIHLEPEETGASFAANSLLKARAFAGRTDLPVLADDSGLEVDALLGAPGVRSARYAGVGAGDAANRARLLAELAGVPPARRTARFVCALALVQRERVLAEVQGDCAGRILEAEHGDGGFGYDPLFLDEQTRRTFAELTPEQKDAVSHRGVALRRLVPYLDMLQG